MKKFYAFLLCLLLIRLSAQTNNPSPYCLSGYISTSSYPEISNVQVISPTGTVISNTSGHTPSPGYIFYNSIGVQTLNPIVVYTVQVTFKNVDMETMLRVWGDYNGDWIFQNNELLWAIPQGSVGTGMAVVKQGTFSLPTSCGNLRMRVSLGWHYANWSTSTFALDSCHVPNTGDGSAGETEDYFFAVQSTQGELELSAEKPVMLYPNPANSEVYISEELQAKTDHYEIVDRLGRKITHSNQFPINVTKLPKDLYYIRLSLKNGEVRNSKLQVN